MLFSIKQGGGSEGYGKFYKNNAVIFGNLPLAFYFFISKYISKNLASEDMCRPFFTGKKNPETFRDISLTAL